MVILTMLKVTKNIQMKMLTTPKMLMKTTLKAMMKATITKTVMRARVQTKVDEEHADDGHAAVVCVPQRR